MDFSREKIDSIRDKENFVKFIYKLSNDFRENTSEWTNQDIESFLEALARWVEDSDGYYQNIGIIPPKIPDWKNIAEMFIAAKYYE
ncbi:hypothetical protein JWG45_01335 [Leptospira sp. 201903070]|uniref:DUF7660 domain-containing protein n=1 Tax=Leptospira ainlahdjerensis TaxID=2810033 RepID=A0ABS2U5Y3_9LEPT|nr:hypothetical protein [Leptospira ainlahdjerensis]MBM9575786.1 hypothetical protein [Leptospira ainlahdjerensis]